MGIVNDVQEGIKAFGEIAVKPLLAVAFATGFLLFAPLPFLDLAGLSSLRNDFRPWIGGLFTLSCSYLLAHAVKQISENLKTWMGTRARLSKRMKSLEFLTADEKQRLLPYILDERSSVMYPIDDGVVGGLLRKGILYRGSNIGNLIGGFPYNLQHWARQVLIAHPEYLDGAEEFRTTSWMER